MKPYILLTSFFLACSTAPEGQMNRLAVNHISTVVAQNTNMAFTVNATVPEAGCWDFHHYDWFGKDFDYTFIVIGQRKTTDPCLQVLGSIEPTFHYTVPKPGTYTFHFWVTDSTAIDTTLTVM